VAQTKKVAKKTKSVEYKLAVGDKAPSFRLPATSGQTVSLADLKGHPFVLYFYPKDNTPGCTLEGQDFKRLQKKFSKLDCTILGVSKDSIAAHEKFREKCGFPFELLSDEDGQLCAAFDVIQEKSLYGRKFIGIERSTFFIDAKGVVRGEWRKVKVNGHAEAVLDFATGETSQKS
jgi:thioredoxin-dependent peroxiredoxin